MSNCTTTHFTFLVPSGERTGRDPTHLGELHVNKPLYPIFSFLHKQAVFPLLKRERERENYIFVCVGSLNSIPYEDEKP